MGALKEKTVVYVTHQVEFLPAADLILVSEVPRKFSCFKILYHNCFIIMFKKGNLAQVYLE